MTPESALAAELGVVAEPVAAPAKKPAVRIRKDVMAREKQAEADAERKPPRARREGDTRF
jgi:hypothetical protein